MPAGVGRSNVATFVDGVFIENSSAISMGLVDLDRVEIIEGPTSALYGRSGFAGAINYITKKPTDVLQADGDITYGQYGRLNLTADVNGPIIPGVLRAGVGVRYADADGDYKDSVTGLRAGGYDQKDIRANIDWTPIAKLDISAGYYYGDDLFDQDPLVTTNAGQDGRVIGKYVANPIQVAALPVPGQRTTATRERFKTPTSRPPMISGGRPSPISPAITGSPSSIRTISSVFEAGSRSKTTCWAPAAHSQERLMRLIRRRRCWNCSEAPRTPKITVTSFDCPPSRINPSVGLWVEITIGPDSTRTS